MGELLEALRASAPPVQWDTAGLKARLEPLGISSKQVELMCSACVSQKKALARGLRRAVAGLVQICPDEPLVQGWYRALTQLATTNRRLAAGLDAMPYATKSPVARFLSETAARLPRDVARDVHRHMLHLVATDIDAQNSAYTTYLAAKHLADERLRNRDVAAQIESGRILAAIAIMAPPTVAEPAVLEAYRAALRTALGHRRHPVRGHHPSRPKQTGRSRPVHSGSRQQPPRLLTDVLASVKELTQPEDESVDGRMSATRLRSGLNTNAALGIPRGLSDIDPLSLHIIFERLASSDLDESARWLFSVVLTVLYCTGWPTHILTEFGRAITFEPSRGTVTIPGELHALADELEGKSVSLLMAPELIRQLTSVLDASGGISMRLRGQTVGVTGGHVSAVLRHLGKADAAPVTLSMLHGAAWHAGRAEGWTPQRLVLATCTSDPAFKQACHYPALPCLLDVQPLHELMLSLLREGERDLLDIHHGHGFAVI
jgi:hypothetical protein